MQYVYDNLGILTEATFPETPGFGTQMPGNGVILENKLKNKKGYAWIYKNGETEQVEDNRGAYYSTETGGKVDFNELGAIPDGLTTKEPNSVYDEWVDGEWVKNEQKEAEAKRAAIQPITKRQAMLQLNKISLYQPTIDMINQSDNLELKIEFECSSTFERQSPFIIGMAKAFNLTNEQVDELFEEAAKL